MFPYEPWSDDDDDVTDVSFLSFSAGSSCRGVVLFDTDEEDRLQMANMH